MSSLHSIVLGFIQGLTEFLPISSSAHLIILPWIFGWKKHPLIFDIILHLGTFCAIVIYFRRDWIDILRGGLLSIRQRTLKGSYKARLFWHIVIASIPGIIFGSMVGNRVEDYFRKPIQVGLTLGVFGLFLYLAELLGKKNKSITEVSWPVSLLIGISQMLAIIPGVSRSGVTITAAMALGIDRESSVRFSFLLGAPIIFAAACYSIRGAFFRTFDIGISCGIGNFISYPGLLAGFFTAFLSSILAIHFLFKFIRRYPLIIFAVYRLIASTFVIIVFFRSG
jgi:undecaprenyl-diphosphatase